MTFGGEGEMVTEERWVFSHFARIGRYYRSRKPRESFFLRTFTMYIPPARGNKIRPTSPLAKSCSTEADLLMNSSVKRHFTKWKLRLKTHAKSS